MRRSILGGGTAVLAAATAAVVAAATVAGADANAETQIVSAAVGPSTLVVGTTGAKTLRATVTATDDAGVLWADVDLRSARGGDFNYVDNMAGSTAPGESTWTGTTSFTKWYTPGKWYADVYVFSNGGGSTKVTRTFYVKRATRFDGFNASEPVRAGTRVTVTGRLLRVDAAADLVGFPRAPVQVQFLPSGARTWRTRATVSTDARGRFSVRLPMGGPGAWRAGFATTDAYAGSKTRTDAVAYVRRP